MKVLVTGATGFVGRALVNRLLRQDGIDVRAAVRRHDRLPSQVEQTRGELDPERDWSESLRDVDTVVHLAARVHVMRDTGADPAGEYRRVNVAGTMALARQAAAAGVRRFIFLSSIKVHGDSGLFSERDDLAPTDAYGQSKRDAEVGLHRLTQEHELELVVIRPPLVYGPGVGANFAQLINAITRGLPLPFGAVNNRRSLIGIDNLVDFVITCITHPAARNQTFLVSDGEDLSTPDLIRRLARALGRPARLLAVPPPLINLLAGLCGRRDAADRLLGSLQADITKAARTLSWSPPVEVDEGFLRTARGQ